MWVLLVLTLAGCPAGTIGEVIAPPQQKASEALGDEEECREVAAYAEPLIVDWKAQQRLDLELAMKDGVAVVAYTCDRFELLKQCRLTGGYRFAGVSRKEDVVRLTNQDEVKANLPLSGVSLGAEMERGSTIDLALVMVGKKATTLSAAGRPELEGECEGATHFVRAAFIGAFAMDRGTVGSARVAAEIFDAGVKGKTDARRREMNKDGSAASCKKSSPDAEAPPAECQAALRIELVPISDEPVHRSGKDDGKAKKPKAVAQKNPCPKGLVLSEGKCTKPSQAQTYLCEDRDLDDCKKQCDAGDPGSCYNLGLLLTSDSANRDVLRAEKVFKKACEAGQDKACFQAGVKACYFPRGYERKEGEECRSLEVARKLLTKGCDDGDPSSCLELGSGKRFGYSDEEQIRFAERACDLGSSWGCSMNGFAYLEGTDTVKKDVEKGIAVLKRSCEGEGTFNCTLLYSVFSSGKYMKPDPKRQVGVLRIACQRNDHASCGWLGDLLETGVKGVARNLDRAVELWRKACPLEGMKYVPKSCHNVGRYLRFKGEKQDEALNYFVRGCDRGVGCRDAAVLAKELVNSKLHAQCAGGDGLACEELHPRLLLKGCTQLDGPSCTDLRRKYPEKARELFERRCRFVGHKADMQMCKWHVEMGGKLPKKKRAK